MSDEKKRKGLGGLSDDQIEILYRQTQDGMRKKGLPSKRRVKDGGYANYNDEDHSRARTIDKDFYRGKGSFQYNESPKGQLEKAFGVKRDPETDPSLLFNEAFGDTYQRKNLSGKDVADMMIDVKDERFKRTQGAELKSRIQALERAGQITADAPKGDLVIDTPTGGEGVPEAVAGDKGFTDKTMLSNKQPQLFDESSTADTPQKDPQAFADQYKLNLIQQGANNNPGDAAPKLKLNP